MMQQGARRLSRTISVIAGAAVFIFLSGAHAAFAGVALNKEWRVSVSYPDTWREQPPDSPNEVIGLTPVDDRDVSMCRVFVRDLKDRSLTAEGMLKYYKDRKIDPATRI